jgi:rhodanese-related sulfurtransferase
MRGPLDASTAKRLAHSPSEIALLDVREHGRYGEGHPFLAAPCPYSRLEILAPSLAPRCGVQMLLIDDGDGVAESAATALADLGYRDVAWLEGGASAWSAAGFTLFKGVNTPGKTLGELLDETWHVPRLGVADVQAWKNQARAFMLFDSRPADEYRKMTLPGAECLPNGELAHRVGRAVSDASVPIIVHCAGRTRSIVGAAGLRLAGVENLVYALENGTQGWALAGLALQHGGIAAPFPAMDAAANADSAARARALGKTHDLPFIDAAELRRLAKDESRTLFLIDVRTAEEFARATFCGAVWAPAGQLVQSSDQWIGVRRARVVLADDTGLRAALAAFFLRQLNYDVFILPGCERMAAEEPLARADAPRSFTGSRLRLLAARDLGRQLAQGALAFDLRTSMDYRSGRLAGANWSIRPLLMRGDLDPARPAVLIGPDDVVALAAKDLARRGFRNILHLEGDCDSWRAAGLDPTASPGDPSDDDAIDYLFFVHDRHDGNLESARRYLAWERGLTAQLDPQERSEFRIGANPFAFERRDETSVRPLD